ncbi:MAG: exodeoxyribonuclease VII large subunit [Verrucomicrobia bacterium]|nr:exodeoxyribonuclease VII large subunit [Verrucomicrobiota bacterium]MDA1087476.1 exodeoxyribonuclease VII large subunit [Verrucomicrobiota bacterium]
MGASEERKIFGVGELTRLIKRTLERDVGMVWIEGEISNVRRPSSGHIYFTIKDESAQISAVMFRGDQYSLKFTPADGVQVEAHGQVSVYERSGQYQLVVRHMEEGGEGALKAAFEKLKQKLFKEGLFDDARKKALPALPRRIGVVTSPTGAAIRDILKVISRRFPNLQVVVAPVKVQGEGAAEEVAAAIDALNRLGGIDVMIVGRGGGSLEDLWAFNEEPVARAIARSDVPVISAVGHEIDFTISDLVADVRAPTPSAAAEIVVDRKDAIEQGLQQISRRLAMCLRESLLDARGRLRAAAGSYVFREPQRLVAQYRQRIDGHRMRMAHHCEGRVREAQQRIDDATLRAGHAIRTAQRSASQDVKRLALQLKAMNPLEVLQRGYSVTQDARGEIIRDGRKVKRGQRMVTRVARGTIESEVLEGYDGEEKD